MSCIEDARSPITMAVEPLGIPCIGQRRTKIAVGEAIRVGVIRNESEIVCETVFYPDHQSVVTSDCSVVRRVDPTVGDARDRIQEGEQAALRSVTSCGANGIGRSIDSAWAQSQEHCRIHFSVAAPEVGGLIAEVTDRSHPVVGELPLVGYVPIGDIGRLGV